MLIKIILEYYTIELDILIKFSKICYRVLLYDINNIKRYNGVKLIFFQNLSIKFGLGIFFNFDFNKIIQTLNIYIFIKNN